MAVLDLENMCMLHTHTHRNPMNLMNANILTALDRLRVANKNTLKGHAGTDLCLVGQVCGCSLSLVWAKKGAKPSLPKLSPAHLCS